MTKSNYYSALAASFFAVTCFLLCSVPARAVELSIAYPYPYDTLNWQADERQGGTVEITSANPRGNAANNLVGNASLELKVNTIDSPTTEINDSLLDWAFYVRNSTDAIATDWTSYNAASYDISTELSWGLLSEIDTLSFDWFRETPRASSADDPWNVQTLVLRLLIGDTTNNGLVFSELVWEAYYTDFYKPIVIGDWVHQSLYNESEEGQNFWRHYFNEDTYSYDNSGTIENRPYDAIPDGKTLSYWDNLYNNDNYDAYVYGLSVGVGSYWPGIYTGYVDNVLISFNDGTTGFYNNFELPAPVPEPATLLLFGSGIGIFAAGRRWRGKRGKA